MSAFYIRKTGRAVTQPNISELAAQTGCKVASEVESPTRDAESLSNESIGAKVADFCNQNDCTWNDLVTAYTQPKIPAKQKIKSETKSETPKSGGGYDRRLSKLGI